MRPDQPRDVSVPGSALAALCLLLVVGLVHGWLAFGCYFVNEHRRLAWHEIVLMWTGDVLALFWFVQYCARWWAGERVIERTDLQDVRIPRSVWFVMGSLLLGMTTELGLTLMLRHDEFQGFGRGVPAVCQVTAVTPATRKGVPIYWKVDGHYLDATRQQHPVTFYVRESDELPRLPGQIRQAIHRKQLPIALPILYDRDRPARSWIPQMGWDDNNRLHHLSLVIVVFQFIVTFFFFCLLRESIRRHQLPWWTELHKVLPLVCEALIVALLGGIDLSLVKRLCP